jgi:hypothetical protein
MKPAGWRILTLILFILVYSSFGMKRMDYSEGMKKNVCKIFRNDVLLYFVFVDSKETMSWTEFDMQSTLDSINIAVKWLQDQALKNNISLRIKTSHFIGNPYATVKKNLPQGTVEKTLYESGLKSGIASLNDWADGIAKKVGATFNIPAKDGIPDVKNPKDNERLIAFLRDDYAVESVALIFLVNNYYKNDISICLNTFNTDNIEFAIVSYKYPAEIAHNVLALFGAAPLFKGPFRKNEKKIKMAQDLFPNDIMQEPYGKNIQRLEIGDYTKFLVGWSESLDSKYHKLLTDNYISF